MEKKLFLPKSSLQKKNYQRMTDRALEKIEKSGKKPRLLLHACCGPCSSYVLEYIADHFETTIFYYNPNIYPAAEYERRLSELEDFLPRFPPALKNKVKLVKADYSPEEFYGALDVKNCPELAKEPEKGERCRRCYRLRLEKSHGFARENGFDYLCTTLSISPFKDSGKINAIGEEICAACVDGPQWLYSDFKKKSGFLRSLELTEEYGLFRQTYCGCVFSKENSGA